MRGLRQRSRSSAGVRSVGGEKLNQVNPKGHDFMRIDAEYAEFSCTECHTGGLQKCCERAATNRFKLGGTLTSHVRAVSFGIDDEFIRSVMAEVKENISETSRIDRFRKNARLFY
ncbi:MAG TPA: hypothetical protein DHU55_09990 [Blastocatellia bacterium]|nr:hypothetical protein [Spartobacteria bacterium]HCX30082.1 hypothetical protein [Blastocatellia bacterium]